MIRVVVIGHLSHALRMPHASLLNNDDYARIERAIVFVSAHFHEQPGLERIAAVTGLSPAHFNRLFRRWAGITPKQFVQRLTLDAAQWRLSQSHSVMRAALEAGLSGPGRLHDLFITLEAMTPGEFKSGGAGLQLSGGLADTPFGPAWLVWHERGICQLDFVQEEQTDPMHWQRRWPKACWQRDDRGAAARLQPLWQHTPTQPLRLLVSGSNFQLQVWRALLKLGSHGFTDYGSLAAQVQRPAAARAVGNAVGANPLLYLIPCHRVLRAHGGLGGYAGGLGRKQVMLAWEYAQTAARAEPVDADVIADGLSEPAQYMPRS